MNTPRRGHWFAGLLLAVACAHGPPPAPPPEASPTAPFTPRELATLSGTWVHVDDPSEAAALDAAVKRAVSGMGGLAQAIAAEQLKGRTVPRAQYVLSFDGDQVTIASPGEPAERGQLNGPPVVLTNRFGDQSQTTFRINVGALVERGTSNGGSGRTVFAPEPGGKTMKVTRVAESEQLSAPLEVEYTYRRQP